ncbi:hypothetical protein R1flu_009443 [Riccia fluitans]|uniref:Uncharacterized protein n=1 Tax=Riccia fluitans TaxID=41844 RepID=A0ABD1Z251_9MARC
MTRRLTSQLQKKKDKVIIKNQRPAAQGAATPRNLAKVNQEKLIHALLLARRSSKIQQAKLSIKPPTNSIKIASRKRTATQLSSPHCQARRFILTTSIYYMKRERQ